MKTLKLSGLFLVGLIAGGAVMNWWCARVFWSAAIGREADMAFLAAQQAEWLAGLRLNQQAEVIQQMETAMDGTVAALAAYEGVTPADEQTRKMRDRFLVPVKVYHDSYAPPVETAAVVKRFLAKIPPRNPTSTCGSAICRLDNLRLAANKTLEPNP